MFSKELNVLFVVQVSFSFHIYLQNVHFYMQKHLSEISVGNSLEIWSPCFYGTSFQMIPTKFYCEGCEANSCEDRHLDHFKS